MLALRLAKAGWWGGDPDAVEMAPTESVLDAADYEKFTADYERAFIRLNTKEG